MDVKTYNTRLMKLLGVSFPTEGDYVMDNVMSYFMKKPIVDTFKLEDWLINRFGMSPEESMYTFLRRRLPKEAFAEVCKMIL